MNIQEYEKKLQTLRLQNSREKGSLFRSLGFDSDSFLKNYEISSKVGEKLKEFLKSADWNGHYNLKGSHHLENWESRMSFFRISSWTGGTLQELHEAMEKGVLLNAPIPLPRFHLNDECWVCGNEVRLGFDGQKLIVLNECPFPNGLVSEWELNVPSGRIAVQDDLRDWFHVPSLQDSGARWCQEVTLEAAKDRLSHGYVGNTCPRIYFDGEKYTIGHYSDCLWDDETGEESPNPESCPFGEKVGGICTDLWWYSIADYEELSRREKKFGVEAQCEFIDVKPGVYRFRHDHNVDHDDDVVAFATFQWVRDPDPVEEKTQLEKERIEQPKPSSLLSSVLSYMVKHPYMGMGLPFEEYEDLDVVLKHWRSLSMEQKVTCIEGEISYIFFTSGNGLYWEDFSDYSEVGEELAKEFDGKFPSFDYPYSWYPLYDLSRFAQPLPEEVVLVLLNACQCALTFGAEFAGNGDHSDIFEKLYRIIRKNNPEFVWDPEFDEWFFSADVGEYIKREFHPTENVGSKKNVDSGPLTSEEKEKFLNDYDSEISEMEEDLKEALALSHQSDDR